MAPQPPTGPVFFAPSGGMGAFASAVADDTVARGATIRVGRSVVALERDGDGWRVDDERFDAVILATPAAASAVLFRDIAPEASDALGAVDAVDVADVVMVALAIPRSVWPDRLHGRSGYLVPKPRQRLVTACSFGSQKWSHWSSDDHEILRVSLGRDGLPVLDHDDATLLQSAVDEVGLHLGLDLQPTAHRLTRWAGAFPQYRPLHAERVRAIEALLPPGVTVCGASHHGIGIPACIHSAQRAAATTLARLASMEE